MALNVARANTILHKLGFPQIRKANHFEQSIDEYGTKHRWAVDRGEFQANVTAPTINRIVARILEDHWDGYDGEKLTDQEREELRAVPSNVSRLIW